MVFFARNRAPLTALILFAGMVTFVFYNRFNSDTPDNYEVKKANYRLEDGQIEEAMAGFQKALALQPDNKMAHLGIAVSHLQAGQLQRAVSKFDWIIETYPDYAVAYADRGVAHDRLGNYEAAMNDYKTTLTLSADLSEGPGWLWRFMRNIDKPQSTIGQRAAYLEAEMKKPASERLLRIPELDDKQQMYRVK